MAGAQCVDWAHTFGGNMNTTSPNYGDEKVTHTVLDDSGNVYVAGRISKNSAMASTMPIYFAGNQYGYLAKLDSNGNVLWYKLFGADIQNRNENIVSGLEVSKNKIFLAGQIDAGGIFNKSRFHTDTLFNSNYSNYFMAILDINGDFVSYQHWNATTTPVYIFNSLTGDGAGNAYGLLRDPWQRRIVKFDSTGQQVWSRLLADSVNSFKMDFSDLYVSGSNFILSGRFGVNGSLPLYFADTSIITSPKPQVSFYLKVDTNMKCQTLKVFSGNSFGGLFLNDKYGGVLAAQDTIFTDSLALPASIPGGGDQYFVSINENGSFNFLSRFTPSQPASSYPSMVKDEASGNYFFTRGVSSSALFNGELIHSSGSNWVVVGELNPQGQLLWHKFLPTTNSGTTIVYNLRARNGILYMYGQASGNISYDTQTLPFAGGATDGFLIKLRRDSACPVAVNVASLQPTAAVVIYPNPARERVHITASSAVQGVRLVNMLGQVVLMQAWQSHENLQIIEVGHLPNGYYRMLIESNGEVQTKPLVIRR